jgi:putative mRNA 3-end processing factor
MFYNLPMADTLITLSEQGFYCPQGDFYIDPWQPVNRAVITHAHSDHARWGSRSYLTSRAGEGVLRARMAPDASIQSLEYGEVLRFNGVELSLHPAGHILGSSQVRVAYKGEVWCISGDYKTEADSTCATFEPVRCNTFITEATFALPIYRWQPQAEIFAQINSWWRANQAAGRTSLLLGYALGKAQRLIAGLDPSIGPILCHGAVERLNAVYRAGGIALPSTGYSGGQGRGFEWSQALIVAPPSAHGTPWTRRFGEVSAGFASGWMRIRGARRRRAVDRGFVLSDHADWPGLLAAIGASGAERVWVTHGYTAVLARWLEEQGLESFAVPTRFEGEAPAQPDESELADEL